jgi:hypothetical protein
LPSLQEGLSETANKGDFFDQHLLNEKNKKHFLAEIACIALFATQIPLSIFINLFKQRFEKHLMLESMLEIFQQSYIQIETESDEFNFLVEIFPHTRYGVRDVASVLLIMVQLETLYSMHPLQCYITGT